MGNGLQSETAASFSSTVSSITCINPGIVVAETGGQLQQRPSHPVQIHVSLSPFFNKRLLLSPKIKIDAIQTRPVIPKVLAGP